MAAAARGSHLAANDCVAIRCVAGRRVGLKRNGADEARVAAGSITSAVAQADIRVIGRRRWGGRRIGRRGWGWRGNGREVLACADVDGIVVSIQVEFDGAIEPRKAYRGIDISAENTRLPFTSGA